MKPKHALIARQLQPDLSSFDQRWLVSILRALETAGSTKAESVNG
jgi:hypothetical protein